MSSCADSLRPASRASCRVDSFRNTTVATSCQDKRQLKLKLREVARWERKQKEMASLSQGLRQCLHHWSVAEVNTSIICACAKWWWHCGGLSPESLTLLSIFSTPSWLHDALKGATRDPEQPARPWKCITFNMPRGTRTMKRLANSFLDGNRSKKMWVERQCCISQSWRSQDKKEEACSSCEGTMGKEDQETKSGCNNM